MDDEGTEGQGLAAVLLYYGMIDRVDSSVEKLVCPFHADRNPSMKVDFIDGSFYCFGCGARGRAKDFVKRYEKQNRSLDDLECEVKYRRILKQTDERETPRFLKPAQEVVRGLQRQQYDEAYGFYHGLRATPWTSPEYPEEQAMLEYMQARGFTAETLAAARAKVTFSDPYQLIFPVLDNGKFKGWVSRTADPVVASYRKYLYNTGFRKALCLVGDYGTFKGERDGHGNDLDSYVVVVEGYMDRLKLLQLGVKNVVAIFGWKMSEIQEQKLRDCGIVNIVSALDNDDCGRKGTAWLLEKKFNVTRFCYLKGLKDPGDMDEQSFAKMWERTMRKYGHSVRSYSGTSG